MRAISSAAFAVSATMALAVPRVAHAGGMDIVPERLVLQPVGLGPGQTCQAVAANPGLAIQGGRQPEQLACGPNDPAFRNLVGELGFAMAPSVLHPARTTGVAGFVVTLEASFTSLNTRSVSRAESGGQEVQTNYWSEGTKGGTDASGSPLRRNDSPSSTLQIWSLRVRKGLPLGFELGAAMGVVPSTSYAVLGADLRWALLEGFRKGILGYVPDIAAGGGVRTLTGSTRLYLTTASFDVTLSKPIPISGVSSLTPHIGFQRLWIFGNSSIVDLTPNTDALSACGYEGQDAVKGAPLCRNSLSNGRPASYDFANNATFDPVRLGRNRGFLGVTYRYDLLHVAGQLLSDLGSPSGEGNDLAGGAQWTFSIESGVAF